MYIRLYWTFLVIFYSGFVYPDNEVEPDIVTFPKLLKDVKHRYIEDIFIPPNGGPANTDPRLFRPIHPIKLTYAWSPNHKLAILGVAMPMSILPCIFYVWSFIMETTLRRPGNVYFACSGVADLLICAIVIPTVFVVLLDNQSPVSIDTCRRLHFTTSLSTYSYSIYFFLGGLESVIRVCKPDYFNGLTWWNSQLVVGFIPISVALAYCDVYLALSTDYCTRVNQGSYTYILTSTIILHIVPFFIGFIACYSTFSTLRNKTYMMSRISRTYQFQVDLSLAMTNCWGYFFYGVGWLPYLNTILRYPDSSDYWFYYTAWIGLVRVLITGVYYSVFNKVLRQKYKKFFMYVFCKKPLDVHHLIKHRNRRNRQKDEPVPMHVLANSITAYRPPSRRADFEERETNSV